MNSLDSVKHNSSIYTKTYEFNDQKKSVDKKVHDLISYWAWTAS